MVKGAILSIEWTTMVIWGVNVVAIIQKNDFAGMVNSTDGVLRILFSIFGICFLIIRAHHVYHNNRIDRDKKRIENKVALRKYEKSLKEDYE